MRKYKLAVIGVGSAGIQAICHFLSSLDSRWQVISIHDPKIDIVGIGESTNPTFTSSIEYGLDFDLLKDLESLDATLKFGTQFKDWRKHDFVNPLLTGAVAVHFNTHKLKTFAFERLPKIWKDKFVSIEGNVKNLNDHQSYVQIELDDQIIDADFVVDCRGFPNLQKFPDEYTTIKGAPVNHALVHNKTELRPDLKYTNHIATIDGWMFEVPLTSRTSHGYLFNDKITSVEQAKVNFAKKINVDVKDLQNIEYKFNSYYCKQPIKNRIIRNGNAAVFFEPMFANSLWLYNWFNKLTHDYIASHSSIDEVKSIEQQEYLNQQFIDKAIQVEEMICYNYHGGSIYDTDFWKYTKEYASNRLTKSGNLKRVTPVLQDMNSINGKHWIGEAVWIYGPLNLCKIDKNFGYNYFS